MNPKSKVLLLLNLHINNDVIIIVLISTKLTQPPGADPSGVAVFIPGVFEGIHVHTGTQSPQQEPQRRPDHSYTDRNTWN